MNHQYDILKRREEKRREVREDEKRTEQKSREDMLELIITT